MSTFSRLHSVGANLILAELERQTDRQIDRQTNRQKDEQMKGQTDRQT